MGGITKPQATRGSVQMASLYGQGPMDPDESAHTPMRQNQGLWENSNGMPGTPSGMQQEPLGSMLGPGGTSPRGISVLP